MPPGAKVSETSRGEYSVLYANPPASEDTVPIGVVLLDPTANHLHLRLRQDWDVLIRDEDTWYFEQLPKAIADLQRDLGAKPALDLLTQGSNAVTADDPRPVLVSSFGATLNRLYTREVQTPIRRFETHLPLYSLHSAAGLFLENAEVEPEGWLEIPGAKRLTQGQFIVHIQGTSMEPVVPDGSLAVFDTESKGGSRVGRLVLVEERRRGGANAYTLKRYASTHQAYSEDTNTRSKIELHPLNPEHEVIPLDPEDDRYHILGIFLRTLDADLAAGLVDE